MNKEYTPITVSEAYHYADIAQNLPRNDAEAIQRALYIRAFETKCTSSEILGAIQSITEHFVDEDREMRRAVIEKDLRLNGLLKQEHIDADDDQIVIAIRKTLPNFQTDSDWGGIYRILVDCCDFPPVKAVFVRRMARMGIYPEDNIVNGIERSIRPQIRGDEWCNHSFTYQAIVKGVSNLWPKTYKEWMISDLKDRDFIARREIATIFFNNLIEVISKQKVY